jgi:pentose-5-phosphate-3-epimerase
MPRGRDIRLEVDGGVKVDNFRRIVDAGADTLVAGSAIFQPARLRLGHPCDARATGLRSIHEHADVQHPWQPIP